MLKDDVVEQPLFGPQVAVTGFAGLRGMSSTKAKSEPTRSTTRAAIAIFLLAIAVLPTFMIFRKKRLLD
jgi:hypothetical protein